MRVTASVGDLSQVHARRPKTTPRKTAPQTNHPGIGTTSPGTLEEFAPLTPYRHFPHRMKREKQTHFMRSARHGTRHLLGAAADWGKLGVRQPNKGS